MPIYAVTVKFIDEQGRTTNREILYDVVDEAALLVAAGLMTTDLAAMTQCGIVDYTYRRTVDVSGAAGVGSNIDAGATFRFTSALPISPVVKIPDPVLAILDGQGGIDLLAALVVAWFANYNPGDCVCNVTNPTQPTAIAQGTLDK